MAGVTTNVNVNFTADTSSLTGKLRELQSLASAASSGHGVQGPSVGSVRAEASPAQAARAAASIAEVSALSGQSGIDKLSKKTLEDYIKKELANFRVNVPESGLKEFDSAASKASREILSRYSRDALPKVGDSAQLLRAQQGASKVFSEIASPGSQVAKNLRDFAAGIAISDRQQQGASTDLTAATKAKAKSQKANTKAVDDNTAALQEDTRETKKRTAASKAKASGASEPKEKAQSSKPAPQKSSPSAESKAKPQRSSTPKPKVETDVPLGPGRSFVPIEATQVAVGTIVNKLREETKIDSLASVKRGGRVGLEFDTENKGQLQRATKEILGAAPKGGNQLLVDYKKALSSLAESLGSLPTPIVEQRRTPAPAPSEPTQEAPRPKPKKKVSEPPVEEEQPTQRRRRAPKEEPIEEQPTQPVLGGTPNPLFSTKTRDQLEVVFDAMASKPSVGYTPFQMTAGGLKGLKDLRDQFGQDIAKGILIPEKGSTVRLRNDPDELRRIAGDLTHWAQELPRGSGAETSFNRLAGILTREAEKRQPQEAGTVGGGTPPPSTPPPPTPPPPSSGGGQGREGSKPPISVPLEGIEGKSIRRAGLLDSGYSLNEKNSVLTAPVGKSLESVIKDLTSATLRLEHPSDKTRVESVTRRAQGLPQAQPERSFIPLSGSKASIDEAARVLSGLGAPGNIKALQKGKAFGIEVDTGAQAGLQRTIPKFFKENPNATPEIRGAVEALKEGVSRLSLVRPKPGPSIPPEEQREIAQRLATQFFGQGVSRTPYQPPAPRPEVLPHPLVERASSILSGRLPERRIPDVELNNDQKRGFRLFSEHLSLPSSIKLSDDGKTLRLPRGDRSGERTLQLANDIEQVSQALPIGSERAQKALKGLADTVLAEATRLSQAGQKISAATGGTGGGSGSHGPGSYDDIRSLNGEKGIPKDSYKELYTPPPKAGESAQEASERREKEDRERLEGIRETISSHARFLGEDMPDLEGLAGPELLGVLNRFDAAIRQRVSQAEVWVEQAGDISAFRGKTKVTDLITRNATLSTALNDRTEGELGYGAQLGLSEQLRIRQKSESVKGLADEETVKLASETAVALKEFSLAVKEAATEVKGFAEAELRAQQIRAEEGSRRQAATLEEYKTARTQYEENVATLGPTHPQTKESEEALNKTIVGMQAAEKTSKRAIDIERKKRENELARAGDMPLPYEEAPEPSWFSRRINRLRGRPEYEGSSLDLRTGGLRGGGGRGEFGGGGGGFKEFFGQGIASGLKYGLPNMLLYGGMGKVGEIVRESAELEVAFARLGDQYDTIFGAAGQSKVAALRKEIADLAVETGQSAVEIADAARQVTAAFGEGSVGEDGKPVKLRMSSALGSKETLSGEALGKNQLEAVTKLARVSGQTIDATQDQARTLGFTFGLSAQAIGDAAVHMEKLTSVPTGNLVRGLSDSAVTAKAAGFEFNEFASVFAAAERRSGARGVAGVADSFNRSLPTLTKNKEALIGIAQANEKLGKNTQFWEGITKSKGSDILLGLAKEYKNLSKAQKDSIEEMIGDPKSFKDLIAALQNSEEIRRTTGALDRDDQKGDLDERTRRSLDTLRGALDQFAQKIRTLGQAILASPLGDFLRRAVQAGATLLRIVEGIFGAFGKVNDVTGGFLGNLLATLAAAKGISLLIGGLAAKNMGGALSKVVGLLGGRSIGSKASKGLGGAASLGLSDLASGVVGEAALGAAEVSTLRRTSRLRAGALAAKEGVLSLIARGRGESGFGGVMSLIRQSGLPEDALAAGQKRFWRWGSAAGPGAEGLTAAQRGGFGLGLTGVGSLGTMTAGGLASAALVGVPTALLAFDQIASNYTDKLKENLIKDSSAKIRDRLGLNKDNPEGDTSSGRTFARGWSVLTPFGNDPDRIDLDELSRRRVKSLSDSGRNPYQAVSEAGLSGEFSKSTSKRLGVDTFNTLVGILKDGSTDSSVRDILEKSLGSSRLYSKYGFKASSEADVRKFIKQTGGTGKFTEVQIEDLIKAQSKQGGEAVLSSLLLSTQGAGGGKKDGGLQKKIATAMKDQRAQAAGSKAMGALQSYFNSNEGRTLQATLDSYSIGEVSASQVLKAYDNQIEDMTNVVEQAKREGAEDVELMSKLAQAKRQRMEFYSQQLTQTQGTLRAIASLRAGFNVGADLRVALDQATARASDKGLAPEARQQAAVDIISIYQQILQNKLNDVHLSFEEKMKILNEGIPIPEEQGRLIGEAEASARMTGDKGRGTLEFYRNEYERAQRGSPSKKTPDWDSVVAVVRSGQKAPEAALAAAQKYYKDAEDAYQAKVQSNAKGESKKGTTDLKNKRNNAKNLLNLLQGADGPTSELMEAIEASDILNRAADAYAKLFGKNGEEWVQAIYGQIFAGGKSAEEAKASINAAIAQAEEAYRAAQAKADANPGDAAAAAVAAGAKAVVDTLNAYGAAMGAVAGAVVQGQEDAKKAAVENQINLYTQQQQAKNRADELAGQTAAARAGGRDPIRNLEVQKRAAAAAEKLARNMANLYRTQGVQDILGKEAADLAAQNYDNQAAEQVLKQIELSNQEQDTLRDIAKSISDRRKSDLALLKAQMGKRGSGVEQLDLEAQSLQLDLIEAVKDRDLAASGGDEAGANRAAAQINSIKIQMIENQRSRREAIRSLADAQSGIMKALADAAGDTVKSAQISLQKSQNDLAEMLSSPGDFSDQEISGKRAEIISNAAAVRDAQYRKSTDDIDFNLELERITKNQAIVQLQAMRQLYLGNEQITREIDRKIHELQKSSNDAFNLPEKLKLPTLYEVRRLSQSASPNDPFTGIPTRGGGYSDNRQIDIKITVQDGTSKEEMISVLNDALQVNRRGFAYSQY